MNFAEEKKNTSKRKERSTMVVNFVHIPRQRWIYACTSIQYIVNNCIIFTCDLEEKEGMRSKGWSLKPLVQTIV